MLSTWRKYQNILEPDGPPHIAVDASEVVNAIKHSNAILARWVSNFDCKEETDFWYVIKDTSFNLLDTNHKVRNKIKKGLKNCRIEIISKEIFIESAYEVYMKAFQNYNTFYKPMLKDQFIQTISQLDDSYEFWGVYNASDKLIGFSQNRIEFDVCKFSVTKFHPDYLKMRPSEALFYSMIEHYFSIANIKYIHNGTRSIGHDTNIQDFLIKKFNFRKAYCRLHVKYHPMIKILVFLLYPFRVFFKMFNFKFFRKISVLLVQENIRIKCKNKSYANSL